MPPGYVYIGPPLPPRHGKRTSRYDALVALSSHYHSVLPLPANSYAGCGQLAAATAASHLAAAALATAAIAGRTATLARAAGVTRQRLRLSGEGDLRPRRRGLHLRLGWLQNSSSLDLHECCRRDPQCYRSEY